MINTHTIEDGSVQLIEMHGIVVNVVAKIIGGTVSGVALGQAWNEGSTFYKY